MNQQIRLKIFIFMLLFSTGIVAQTWKRTIYRFPDTQKTKTLTLRPKTEICIGTLIHHTDSLKESRFYDGKFLGGDDEGIRISLTKVRMSSTFLDGTRINKTIPAKSFLTPPFDSTYQANIAIENISYVEYTSRRAKYTSDVEDFILFSSLFVLMASPFICYNYSDNTFNQDMYQYWALGSTIGIFTGITLQMMGGRTKIKFDPGWPDKKGKTWSFRN